jgi:hypothetical protein
MSIQALAVIMQLTTQPQCSYPGMVPEFWPHVVRAESSYDPLALHDDTANQEYHPATVEDATALTHSLMRRGHSVGVGLSMLTATSEQMFLDKFGLTIEAAFHACANMRAGARHYVRGALSIYNTGDRNKGIANGYVHKVLDQQPPTVPPRSTLPEGTITVQEDPVDDTKTTRAPSCGAPPWDVWGTRECLDDARAQTEHVEPEKE